MSLHVSRMYQSILYRVVGRVAHIELNRPERLNAIDEYMPFEIEQAVEAANLDDNVRVCIKDANEYSIIRIPNTIRIVNLIFEYLFVLIKAAYRA